MKSTPTSKGLSTRAVRCFSASFAIVTAMSFAAPQADAQSLVNGGSVAGSISPAGDADVFTFHMSFGQTAHLRVADTGPTALDPRITIHDPNGGQVASNYGALVGSVAFVASLTGTYTATIEDGGSAFQNTGPYEVHLARFAGANEHGGLVSGGTVSGTIGLGDLDTYEFNALAGGAVQLRVAESAAGPLDPSITVFSPSGAQVAANYGSQVGAVAFAPAVTGTYSVLIQDGGSSYPNTGPYEVHFADFPGANEHGVLVNGGVVTGAITLGDLDTFVFDAGAGETVQLRVAETAAGPLDPSITVYDPNGAFIASNYGSQVGAINFAPSLTGTYSLLVQDGGSSTPNTGPYEVHFVRKPTANEHGALVNGGTVTGHIDLGDLDTFVFDATAGQAVQIRVAELMAGPLDPSITVYDPNGAFVAANYGSQVGAIAFVPAQSGSYTLLVQDGGSSTPNTGPYEVHFARFPDVNEHGSLVNGGTVTGAVTLGDLDTFVFDSTAGQSVQVRVAELAAGPLDPSITVYDPNGAFVASNYGSQVGAIGFVAALTGQYSLLVQDGGSSTPNTGPYEVHYARFPGANEHGSIASGANLSGFITLGDIDTFTMTVNAGAPVTVRATESSPSPLEPRVTVYDPNGAFIASHYGAVFGQVSFTAQITGTYGVLVQDGGSSTPNIGGYGLQMEGGSGQAFCFGDNTSSNCPCGATGNAGEGCANSSGTHGATLVATGSAQLSNDSFQLHASGVPGAKPGLILRGANQLNSGAGNPVGDGLLCIGGDSARSQVQVTTNAGDTTFSHFAGGTFGASSYGLGVPTNYQFWYRDPQNGCSGSGFNFTNAWTVTWLP